MWPPSPRKALHYTPLSSSLSLSLFFPLSLSLLPFFLSFDLNRISTFYVAGTVLGAGDSLANNAIKMSLASRADRPGEGDRGQRITSSKTQLTMYWKPRGREARWG